MVQMNASIWLSLFVLVGASDRQPQQRLRRRENLDTTTTWPNGSTPRQYPLTSLEQSGRQTTPYNTITLPQGSPGPLTSVPISLELSTSVLSSIVSPSSSTNNALHWSTPTTVQVVSFLPSTRSESPTSLYSSETTLFGYSVSKPDTSSMVTSPPWSLPSTSPEWTTPGGQAGLISTSLITTEHVTTTLTSRSLQVVMPTSESASSTVSSDEQGPAWSTSSEDGTALSTVSSVEDSSVSPRHKSNSKQGEDTSSVAGRTLTESQNGDNTEYRSASVYPSTTNVAQSNKESPSSPTRSWVATMPSNAHVPSWSSATVSRLEPLSLNSQISKTNSRTLGWQVSDTSSSLLSITSAPATFSSSQFFPQSAQFEATSSSPGTYSNEVQYTASHNGETLSTPESSVQNGGRGTSSQGGVVVSTVYLIATPSSYPPGSNIPEQTGTITSHESTSAAINGGAESNLPPSSGENVADSAVTAPQGQVDPNPPSEISAAYSVTSTIAFSRSAYSIQVSTHLALSTSNAATPPGTSVSPQSGTEASASAGIVTASASSGIQVTELTVGVTPTDVPTGSADGLTLADSRSTSSTSDFTLRPTPTDSSSNYHSLSLLLNTITGNTIDPAETDLTSQTPTSIWEIVTYGEATQTATSDSTSSAVSSFENTDSIVSAASASTSGGSDGQALSGSAGRSSADVSPEDTTTQFESTVLATESNVASRSALVSTTTSALDFTLSPTPVAPSSQLESAASTIPSTALDIDPAGSAAETNTPSSMSDSLTDMSLGSSPTISSNLPLTQLTTQGIDFTMSPTMTDVTASELSGGNNGGGPDFTLSPTPTDGSSISLTGPSYSHETVLNGDASTTDAVSGTEPGPTDFTLLPTPTDGLASGSDTRGSTALGDIETSVDSSGTYPSFLSQITDGMTMGTTSSGADTISGSSTSVTTVSAPEFTDSPGSEQPMFSSDQNGDSTTETDLAQTFSAPTATYTTDAASSSRSQASIDIEPSFSALIGGSQLVTTSTVFSPSSTDGSGMVPLFSSTASIFETDADTSISTTASTYEAVSAPLSIGSTAASGSVSAAFSYASISMEPTLSIPLSTTGPGKTTLELNPGGSETNQAPTFTISISTPGTSPQPSYYEPTVSFEATMTIPFSGTTGTTYTDTEPSFSGSSAPHITIFAPSDTAASSAYTTEMESLFSGPTSSDLDSGTSSMVGTVVIPPFSAQMSTFGTELTPSFSVPISTFGTDIVTSFSAPMSTLGTELGPSLSVPMSTELTPSFSAPITFGTELTPSLSTPMSTSGAGLTPSFSAPMSTFGTELTPSFSVATSTFGSGVAPSFLAPTSITGTEIMQTFSTPEVIYGTTTGLPPVSLESTFGTDAVPSFSAAISTYGTNIEPSFSLASNTDVEPSPLISSSLYESHTEPPNPVSIETYATELNPTFSIPMSLYGTSSELTFAAPTSTNELNSITIVPMPSEVSGADSTVGVSVPTSIIFSDGSPSFVAPSSAHGTLSGPLYSTPTLTYETSLFPSFSVAPSSYGTESLSSAPMSAFTSGITDSLSISMSATDGTVSPESIYPYGTYTEPVISVPASTGAVSADASATSISVYYSAPTFSSPVMSMPPSSLISTNPPIMPSFSLSYASSLDYGTTDYTNPEMTTAIPVYNTEFSLPSMSAAYSLPSTTGSESPTLTASYDYPPSSMPSSLSETSPTSLVPPEVTMHSHDTEMTYQEVTTTMASLSTFSPLTAPQTPSTIKASSAYPIFTLSSGPTISVEYPTTYATISLGVSAIQSSTLETIPSYMPTLYTSSTILPAAPSIQTSEAPVYNTVTLPTQPSGNPETSEAPVYTTITFPGQGSPSDEATSEAPVQTTLVLPQSTDVPQQPVETSITPALTTFYVPETSAYPPQYSVPQQTVIANTPQSTTPFTTSAPMQPAPQQTYYVLTEVSMEGPSPTSNTEASYAYPFTSSAQVLTTLSLPDMPNTPYPQPQSVQSSEAPVLTTLMINTDTYYTEPTSESATYASAVNPPLTSYSAPATPDYVDTTTPGAGTTDAFSSSNGGQYAAPPATTAYSYEASSNFEPSPTMTTNAGGFQSPLASSIAQSESTEDTGIQTSEAGATQGETMNSQVTGGGLTQNQASQGQATQQPITQAEGTEGQLSQMQASQARATQVQATQGQATQSQATQAQATQAQATQAQFTQDQATQGQATQDQATQSQATPAQATQAQTTQDQATQGQATQGQTTQYQATPGQTAQDQTVQGQSAQTQAQQGLSSQDQASQGMLTQGYATEGQLTQSHSADIQASQASTIQDQGSQTQAVQGQSSNGQITQSQVGQGQETQIQATSSGQSQGGQAPAQSTSESQNIDSQPGQATIFPTNSFNSAQNTNTMSAGQNSETNSDPTLDGSTAQGGQTAQQSGNRPTIAGLVSSTEGGSIAMTGTSDNFASTTININGGTDSPSPTNGNSAGSQTSNPDSGSDTLTSTDGGTNWLPSALVTATSTEPPNSSNSADDDPGSTSTASKASGASNTIGLPGVIIPSATPRAEKSEKLIQIGFKFPLNYPFVASHPVSAAQIFDYLPRGLINALQTDESKVQMKELVPWWSHDHNFMMTLARVYVPGSQVGDLQRMIQNQSSPLYHNSDANVNQLTSLIDSSVSITGDYQGTSSDTGNVNSNNQGGQAAVGAPGSLDQARQPNMKQSKASGRAAGIAVGTTGGAIVAGILLFMLGQWARKRQEGARAVELPEGNEHYPASYHDGSSITESPRGSHRAQNLIPRSVTSEVPVISHPMVTENSLGWQ